MGRRALVRVGVLLDRPTPESFAAFESAAAQIKDIPGCRLLAGDFDYLIRNPLPCSACARHRILRLEGGVGQRGYAALGGAETYSHSIVPGGFDVTS